MGRTPCCEKNGLKKGPWTPEEDQKLINYIEHHGHGSWRALPKRAELLRCGKSCRLRWTNYLRPDIKRGKFSCEEEHRIIELHAIIGNKWSTIAASLPGRTDNEIKNYWNTHLRKRLIRMGIDPVTHRPKTDMIGFSSMSATSLFPSADLNHILGRQTALMENEEFLKHVIADMMMPKNRTESELAVMRSLASQFGQKKSAADLAWAQQPAIGLDFNGLPQTSEHYAQAQTNGCSTDILMNPEINVDHCLNKDHEESVSRFLESCMYSSGFDKSPSPLQMEHHGQHASPSSTLISSVNGPQMKIKQENIPQSEIFVQDQNLFHSDQILCNQTVLNNGIIDLNNEFWKEKMKPASAAIGFSCPNGLEDCKLYSSPMLLPVQGNCAYGSSVNPPEFMLQFGDNSNANVLSNSSLTRHETPGSSEINSEDSNHYWSTMLIKAVGTNPNHPTVLWQ